MLFPRRGLDGVYYPDVGQPDGLDHNWDLVSGYGQEDIVFLLIQETSGSGTFFYVVAALNTDAGCIGSHGFFLGDRIAPQSTESGPGKIIIVNYTDRKRGEPFSKQPSIGKSIYLLFDPETMQFVEVAQDFEREADRAG